MSERALTFDRTVSIGVLVTLAVQTASALLWVGGIETRVATLEVASRQTLPINIRLTRLEEQVGAATASLGRIEHELQNLETRLDR